jgi:hypothetical protein
MIVPQIQSIFNARLVNAGAKSRLLGVHLSRRSLPNIWQFLFYLNHLLIGWFARAFTTTGLITFSSLSIWRASV